MSDNTDPLNRPLIREHVPADSRAFNVSLRGWIALLVIATLCAIVLVISIRVRDVEQVLPALKDLFVPTVTTIVIFYFATKSPNKETKP